MWRGFGGVLLVLILFSVTGCVSDASVFGDEPEVEMTIEYEYQEIVSNSFHPPLIEENFTRENITLEKTNGAWRAQHIPGVLRTDEVYKTEFKGIKLSGECAEELKELIIKNESDKDCVGETDAEPFRWSKLRDERSSRVQYTIDYIRAEQDELKNELEEAKRKNETDRVEELEREIEGLQEEIDFLTRPASTPEDELPLHRYKIVIEYPNSTKYTAETDAVTHEGGHRLENFRWTVERKDTKSEFFSPRMDELTDKLFSQVQQVKENSTSTG